MHGGLVGFSWSAETFEKLGLLVQAEFDRSVLQECGDGSPHSGWTLSETLHAGSEILAFFWEARLDVRPAKTCVGTCIDRHGA